MDFFEKKCYNTSIYVNLKKEIIKMDLIYKKADINDIDNLVDLKIKQNLFFNNRDGLIMENENIVRENIKRILLQELNKTMYFFIATDKKIIEQLLVAV